MSPWRVVAGLLVVSALSADVRLDTLLAGVESRYNRAKTLQVAFREQYTRPGTAQRVESGTLSLRKPGRMRWDYAQPAGKQFVSDGKFLYLFDPEQNLVEKSKMKETEDLRAPLAFLLGKLNFQKEFRNVQGQAEGTSMRITAEPKSDNLPYRQVEFLVADGSRIQEVKVTAFDHSVLDFTFDREVMDPPLADRLFQFQAPPGAKVTEAEP